MSGVNDATRDMYITLFNTLRSLSPKDTGNMRANIMYQQIGESTYKITINAPKVVQKKSGEVVKSDYAWYVNYAMTMAWGRKQNRNRFWVENCINKASRVIGSNILAGQYGEE